MKDLIEIQKFIDNITSTNSRNKKEEILRSYADNESVTNFLKFIYNPFIVTGISEKKWNRYVTSDIITNIPDTLDDMCEVYAYLCRYNTGRDWDIYVMKEFISYHPEHADLIKNIVCKNIQLGVEAKTLNKVYGKGFVPSFDVMLSQKYFEHPEKVDGKRFAITEKIDGQRIIAIKKANDIKFYTREGQRYDGLVDLEDALSKYEFDCVLDGELTVMESSGDSHKDYSNTVKIAHTKGEKHGVKMRVFDMMSPYDFENKHNVIEYKARNDTLKRILEELNSEYFEYVSPFYVGDDVSQIDVWLKYAEEHGMEGVMINILDGKYEFKRSYNLLKVKTMDDIDLKVVDMEEGKNKNKGVLGALICEYKNSTVKVGGGFSDEQRKTFWENKDDYIGMTVVVSYFEETVDTRTNLPSLRFPVFKEFRTDKVIE